MTRLPHPHNRTISGDRVPKTAYPVRTRGGWQKLSEHGSANTDWDLMDGRSTVNSMRPVNASMVTCFENVRAFVIIMAGLERLVAGWCSEQRVPCNTSEDNKCTLLVHRTDINRILLEAGLEIREDHRHAGGVRMAVTRIPVCNSPVWDKPGAWLKNASLKLVSSLIFQHSCFTTIEMYHNFPWSHEMRQGLSRQKALKSFTVHLVLRGGEDRDDPYDKFDILSYLPSPAVELVFESARSAFQVSAAPICGLIAEEILMYVTTLRAENLRLNVRDAHAFLSALMDNDSVTDLGVHACVYAGDPIDAGGMFTSYLNERRGALRKITLTDSVSCGDEVLWMKMIPVLSEMTELEELDVNVSMDLKI
ncbi:hypothetical protein HPB50_015354 [Hyalomma asiaticum]|uniref:Uncharacterized protein n=1 Tax=Hyalomma asiaticum TaxID=266040 RepID=A0ACB7TCF8_HYAAI|nr:hypothetical protein HPB50_015354 [Hyalomma asiaticum]